METELLNESWLKLWMNLRLTTHDLYFAPISMPEICCESLTLLKKEQTYIMLVYMNDKYVGINIRRTTTTLHFFGQTAFTLLKHKK